MTDQTTPVVPPAATSTPTTNPAADTTSTDQRSFAGTAFDPVRAHLASLGRRTAHDADRIFAMVQQALEKQKEAVAPPSPDTTTAADTAAQAPQNPPDQEPPPPPPVIPAPPTLNQPVTQDHTPEPPTPPLDFNEDRDVDALDELFIPAFVRARHETQQLWPFYLVTPEGQRAIQAHQSAMTDLAILNDPRAPPLPSGVVPDAQLTYEQLRRAANVFLHLAWPSNQWPQIWMSSWAQFYADLDNHPIRLQSHGDRAAVIYAARVRQRFFSEVSLRSSQGLTPVTVSSAALRDTRASLVEQDMERTRAEWDQVRCFPASRLSPLFSFSSPQDSCARPQSSPPPRQAYGYRHLPCRVSNSLSCRAIELTALSLLPQRILALSDVHGSPRRPHSGKRLRSPSPSSRDTRVRRPRLEPPAPSSSHQGPRFHAGANGNACSVCAVCLGRHPHDVRHCTAQTFVPEAGGGPTRSTRDERGFLFSKDGRAICYTWQRPRRCEGSGSEHTGAHECSACGDPAHGASRCSRLAAALA